MTRDIIPLPQIEPARGYSSQHAALYLGCSLPTLYQMIHAKRLGSRTLGKRRIIPGNELIRFLNGEPPIMTGSVH